ncbi:MAG: O-antigen ligase family protein [Thermoanaerobaculia bacterium]
MDSVAFGLLVLFAAVAPILYGGHPGVQRTAFGDAGVTPTGHLALELSAFGIAAATLLSKFRLRALGPIGLPFGAILAIVLLGIVQLLPIPEPVLQRLGPVNLEIYHETAEILGSFGQSSPPAPRISIAPWETAGASLRVLAYAVLFASGVLLLRNRPRRRFLLGVVATTSVLQVLLAAAAEATSDRLHGLFASPNSFAGYLQIGAAVAFGGLWSELLTNADRAQELTDPGERLESRLRPLVGYVVIWGIVAIGIGLTRSRGGILAASVTTVLLLVLANFRWGSRARGRASVVALAVAAGVLLAVATLRGAPLRRFLALDWRELRSETRFAIWERSVEAWREFPVLGSGLGTFREAFRRVQPREMDGLVEQAHSDLLQMLVTGGTLGAALAVLAFGSLLVLLLRFFFRQRHREESAVVLAGIGALVALALHGLVEYNFSIPPIPATLACVVGAAWAAGRER